MPQLTLSADTSTVLSHDSAAGADFQYIEHDDCEVDRLWRDGGGFTSLGDYCRVAGACQRGLERSTTDTERYERWGDASHTYRRWVARSVFPSVSRAVSSPDGMFENSDPDGGSVVPPSFVKMIWDKSRFRDTPFKRATTVIIPTNLAILPGIAETSRAGGSRWGGLQAYWLAEGQQLNINWPRMFNQQTRLNKLACLVPVTDELFTDSAMLDSFLLDTVSKEFEFGLNDAMCNGTGAGMLLGVVGAPGTISIAKDTGQAAKTISTSNISNMWIRTHGPSRANSVFYANEEFDPDNLGLPTTPLTGWHGEQPAPTLKGRYCHPLENCKAIGTPGDLIWGDWSQYLLVFGGLHKSVSMDFRFDRGETYFKFIYRVAGQPMWTAPLTSVYGTVTKAPFVTIAQR